MISFDSGGNRFNFRAAGVAARPSDGRFLLHRTVRDPFWTLPGGRCELGETGAEALAREMREELGVAVQVGRLLFVLMAQPFPAEPIHIVNREQ
jgi:ADP-ribose pyrophosphatase YjhB (NUDIX family)